MKKYFLLFSFFLPKSAVKNIHFFFKKKVDIFLFFLYFFSWLLEKNGLLFFSFLKGNALFFRLTSIIIQGAQKVKPFSRKNKKFFFKKTNRKKYLFWFLILKNKKIKKNTWQWRRDLQKCIKKVSSAKVKRKIKKSFWKIFHKKNK